MTTIPTTPAGIWLAGARPKTWPAGVVPVLVGSGVAAYEGDFVVWKAALCLVVGLAMQIGVNYANDYSDGIRGADDRRVGPLRITASRLAEPRSVKRAAFVAFGVGAVAGLVLAVVTAWWLVLIGLACIAGGWFYTGGQRPYGYSGFGEVAVFVFFGLVATMGTAYVQSHQLTSLAFVVASAVGLLAVALLLTNNLRDIPSDAAAGKQTLAVRLGDGGTRWLYFLSVLVPFVLVLVAGLFTNWALLVLVVLPLAIPPVRRVLDGANGRDLVPVLEDTGRLQLVFGLALAVTLAL